MERSASTRCGSVWLAAAAVCSLAGGACGTKDAPTGGDDNGGCSGNKCDGLGDYADTDFGKLAALLEQEGAIKAPPYAVDYFDGEQEVLDQAVKTSVEVVFTADGVETYARDQVLEIVEPYRDSDEGEVLWLFEFPDIDVTIQSGIDHTEVQSYLFDSLLDDSVADEVKKLLRWDVEYFRFVMNDNSAELTGEDLIILHPYDLDGSDGKAIAIDMQYSEYY